MNWISIAITMLVTILLMVAGHYFPWRLLTGGELGRVQSYIYGMAAIAIPLSVNLLANGDWPAAAALWLVIVAGGLAVIACYGTDKFLVALARAREAEEREEALRGRLGEK